MDTVMIHTLEQGGIQQLLDASLQAARQEPRRVEIIQKQSRKRSYRVGALARMADGKTSLYENRFTELGLYIDILC
jgi:hypothetical protein